MRLAWIAGLFGWAAAGGALGEETPFPSAAYVSSESLEVRSGPGAEFYATGLLLRGTPIEIYREHTGGWLAIRPPEGSHAWVAADSLKTSGDEPIAEVVDGLVEAWVGSDAPGVRRHLWQVRLERGEIVELLGEQRLVSRVDRGRETWLKIAPPAGEFRYVHRDGVELRANRRDARVRPAAHSAAAGAANGWQRGRDSASADAAATVTPAATPAGGSDIESFRELANIDVALSYLAAQPLETWDLAALKQRAEAIAGDGQTPLERGYARRMLEQIAEFEDLHFRWRLGQSAAAASFESSDDEEPSTSEQEADVVEEEVGTGVVAVDKSPEPAEMQYDGAGRLRKVYSKNRVAPPYVLVDEQNNVLRFITPAPGLNLHRYLEEEIGVFGQVGQAPDLQAPLITAQRIVRLDRHRR